ncbi:MAG: uroporphyrinogen decarboxylase family protein, partial [Thermoproteota archaeon]
WYSAELRKRTLPQKYLDDKGKLLLYKDLMCGAHEELYLPIHKTIFKNVSVRVFEEEEKDGIVRTTVYYTPLGELRKVDKYSFISFSTATLKYPVNNEEDLKVLKFMYQNVEYTKKVEAFKRQEFLINLWKGWGVVSSLPPRTPFSRLVVEWAGAYNTLILEWRSKESLREVLEVMYSSDDPIYEFITESPAKFVYFGENLSSDVISPKYFEEYYKKYYTKRASMLHKAKKFIYLHIDGKLRGLLPLLASTGIDCAQSLTPYPAGDLKVSEFRKVAGDNIILWGGLPGIFFSSAYKPDLLMNLLKEILALCEKDRKFVIGVADQVPPDGDIQRVKLVSNIVNETFLAKSSNSNIDSSFLFESLRRVHTFLEYLSQLCFQLS